MNAVATRVRNTLPHAAALVAGIAVLAVGSVVAGADSVGLVVGYGYLAAVMLAPLAGAALVVWVLPGASTELVRRVLIPYAWAGFLALAVIGVNAVLTSIDVPADERGGGLRLIDSVFATAFFASGAIVPILVPLVRLVLSITRDADQLVS